MTQYNSTTLYNSDELYNGGAAPPPPPAPAVVIAAPDRGLLAGQLTTGGALIPEEWAMIQTLKKRGSGNDWETWLAAKGRELEEERRRRRKLRRQEGVVL